MDVKMIKPLDTSYGTTAVNGSDNSANAVQDNLVQANANKETTKELSGNDLEQLNYALNKFLELTGADVHFSLHEKTHRLMVKLVDDKTGKVLREYPPHELLDTLAKISDYVGALLDKKA